ncbi:phosphatase PAP2 family protein [Arthrobacter caoxuetaonis]|uniref:phosphatase PAP2 family protein n=1 Tax=Arthrobacter caoxuetaonis TaxID=2886935 RepID=UPI001D13360F|nr:phosphatase PAP2 family protein [Arthrobacter caoxuetaonis]MCC3281717.1 phosphatase PAP2 family protein [Arthrobacter caoxuetaonis]
MSDAPAARLQHQVSRAAQALGKHGVLLLTLAAGLVPALLLALLAGGVYDAVAEEDGVAALDQPVLTAAQSIRSPGLDTAVTWLTNLGGTIGLPLLSAAAVAVLCRWQRSWTPLILTASAAAGSLLMTIAGKALVGRSRPALSDAVPPYEYSASFPSGHSLNSMVVTGTVAYLLFLYLDSRWARIITVVLAAGFIAAVGLSRVYLGHHWLTDVLVAWFLGLAWLAILITVHQLLHARRLRNLPAP